MAEIVDLLLLLLPSRSLLQRVAAHSFLASDDPESVVTDRGAGRKSLSLTITTTISTTAAACLRGAKFPRLVCSILLLFGLVELG